MGKRKKSGRKESHLTEIILLATAIAGLIEALIEMISKLLE